MRLFDRVRELAWGIPITVAGWFVPRQQKCWAVLIGKTNRYEGNIRSLAHYLASQPDTTVYVLNHSIYPLPDLSAYPAIKVVKGHTWAEAKARLHAKHVVFTQANSKVRLNGRYVLLTGINLINVWHGIPLKALGNLIPGYHGGTLKKRMREGGGFHSFCVSSLLERTFFAGAYFFDASRVAVTGIPRNDFLINSQMADRGQQQIQQEIAELRAGRPMFLYAPTWRDYDESAIGLTRADCEQLSALMKAHGALLAFRPHPRDDALFDQLIAGLPNLLLANSSRWEDTNAVLSGSSALISDYSSIMIDYLLLNRPIVGYFWDYEKYTAERGMMFDLSSLFPGPIVSTAAELTQQLRQLLENGLAMTEINSALHQSMLNLFHAHKDGRACERIVTRAYTVK
ncbi:hypothetical protein HPT27_17810 [Permianibacter sp. IMCC34836]|uniref:CDP-glycerol glycerophosphotransferase family protein n=1 Tax=Permianibacter fluminis TaxID=2738515 RepID=UPI0015538DBF|nr:CDP-glycerol glycerophosphotransferase family protein [Permianibacter fluminis]NQD38876.1 hypothetical protein [Permianibacter fluminis]